MDDALYEPDQAVSNKPVPLTQYQMDFIVAKIMLTKNNAEELARFLKMNNLLAPGTNVTIEFAILGFKISIM